MEIAEIGNGKKKLWMIVFILRVIGPITLTNGNIFKKSTPIFELLYGSIEVHLKCQVANIWKCLATLDIYIQYFLLGDLIWYIKARKAEKAYQSQCFCWRKNNFVQAPNFSEHVSQFTFRRTIGQVLNYYNMVASFSTVHFPSSKFL